MDTQGKRQGQEAAALRWAEGTGNRLETKRQAARAQEQHEPAGAPEGRRCSAEATPTRRRATMTTAPALTIIRDTREQCGYSFAAYPGTTVLPGTLKTGDYAPQGWETRCAVERKEVNDLVNCLAWERRRFEAELIRAATDLEYFALVVEAGWEDLARGNYRSNMRPRSVVQSLLAFSVRYRLPVFLAGSRRVGEYIVHGLLAKFVREQEKASKVNNRAVLA